MKHLIFLFLSILFFGGCAVKQEYEKFGFSEANLQKSSWQEINGFEATDFEESLKAFVKGCEKSSRFENLKNSCQKALSVTSAKDFFVSNFTPYKLYDSKGSDVGLLTGYYESTLYGSLKKSEKYKYPVYATPKDIYVINLSSVYPELSKYKLRGRIVGNTIVPYYSREEIENFDEKKYEVIAYVEDDIELFFLHIQGSGKIILEDGSHINIGYAMQNGHKYNAIGGELVKNGHIPKDQVSLQTIAKWLRENPDKKDEIMNKNKSYIFFTKNKQGATGSLGTELIAKKNIAVDRRYIPLGFPVFINTSNPVSKEPINDIVIAADTGGAIKGDIRADFFWGFGDEAKNYAGVTKEPFNMYVFIPNELIKPK
ncbi:MAG: murein transglycosylase A [Arcobacteraceae bacterium]